MKRNYLYSLMMAISLTAFYAIFVISVLLSKGLSAFIENTEGTIIYLSCIFSYLILSKFINIDSKSNKIIVVLLFLFLPASIIITLLRIKLLEPGFGGDLTIYMASIVIFSQFVLSLFLLQDFQKLSKQSKIISLISGIILYIFTIFISTIFYPLTVVVVFFLPEISQYLSYAIVVTMILIIHKNKILKIFKREKNGNN